jgi:MFS family permease
MSSPPSELTTPDRSDRKQSDARYSLTGTTTFNGSINDFGSAKSSLHRSRHISLQSKVDGTAEPNPHHSLYMGDYDSEKTSSLPDTSHANRSSTLSYNYRSRSYIAEDGYQDSYNRRPDAPDQPPRTMDTMTTLTPSPLKMSTFHEIMFVGVIAISNFCTQLGLGITLAPLDIISQSFSVTKPGEQSWMIAGYSLTVGTFILMAGRMGDMFGHKRMLAFGYAWFGVWSAFAGFAVYPQKQVFFDICRTMQGIGPALIMPNGLALLGRAYQPGIKKNFVFSIFGAVAPIGLVVGAIFGSLFAQLVWWPWAFWAFAIALWALAAFSLIVVPRELSGKPVNPPGFDWAGSIMGVIGLILINIAWNNGPLYGWKTPHVYFLLIIGLLCLVAFTWIETRALSPILPVRAMTGPVNFMLACTGFGWGAFGIWVFYSFRFLELIRLSSPLSASVQFTPMVICGLLAAALTGFMLTHTPLSFVMLVAMTAFSIGTIIAATMPPNQSYWAQMFISVIVMPFGMNMSFPAASVILSNNMPSEYQGLAMSLVNTFVNYSISIALGIAGTVEANVVHDMSTPDQMLKGFRSAFYSGIGLSIAGVICGAIFFLRSMMKEGWKVMDTDHD